MMRTHTCGQLSKKNVGEEITLCGWVHSRRDHGGVIFIDLRDRYGLTQIKFDPELEKVTHHQAENIRSEWVLKVTGEVLSRPENMLNEKLWKPCVKCGSKTVLVDSDKVLCVLCNDKIIKPYDDSNFWKPCEDCGKNIIIADTYDYLCINCYT